jgi:hypothetical protein
VYQGIFNKEIDHKANHARIQALMKLKLIKQHKQPTWHNRKGETQGSRVYQRAKKQTGDTTQGIKVQGHLLRSGSFSPLSLQTLFSHNILFLPVYMEKFSAHEKKASKMEEKGPRVSPYIEWGGPEG